MTTELPDIPPGRRVVIRYRLPEGYPQRFTDVIGELVAREPPTIRTADGQTVAIARDHIVAMKALGPRPIRTSEIRALEAAASDGWPGVARARMDGWLVTAGNGYTNRANSAVPLGDSAGAARIDPDVLHRIGEWYTEHGLPLQLRLPDRLAEAPPDWRTWSETRVLGIDLDNFRFPQGPSMVRIDASPHEAWLELHRFQGEDTTPVPPPQPDEAVLTAVHDGEIGFAALGLPTPLAVGRGAVTTAPDGRRWVGLTCVAVAAPHRRHGLGTLICAELIRWGHRHGATHAYVQVAVDNTRALAMYREMGFVDHHDYRYAAPK
ncbi:GNAT family N-acetyltransferase [Nocardia sp. BMG51109]|uniref:N-acetylglutamate synthase, CG3035 family n=1 Tax=Nocardia sp. BMG51109 TaxID=1056816 RepID=UPI000467D377|nr:GNAT family N-acetyltransferase [Nocardia sp. BMG51109]